MRFAVTGKPGARRRSMSTITPTKPPFGLGSTVWALVIAVLLVILAAMAMFFQ